MARFRRWSLVVGVGVLGSSVVGRSVLGQPTTLPPALARADRVSSGLVETEMRHVRYHAAGAVLEIRELRGALRPTVTGKPPWFEDRNSFVIAVDTADVAIEPSSLTTLLNEHIFHYQGSPLVKLTATIEAEKLKLTGRLHHLPFSILGAVTPTPDGRLRIHPTSVKVFGISVKGLMKLFGVELDNLIKVGIERGVAIDGDDIVLSPSGLVPPPTIEGRITAVRLAGGTVATTFGRSKRTGGLPVLGPRDSSASNFMLFRGGVLRFGKLTMADADLRIVDADPSDPFDFDLLHLNEQLVAGQTTNRADFGLVTVIPDYDDLLRHRSLKSSPPPAPVR